MTLPLLPNTLARRLFLHRHALGSPPEGPAKGEALQALIETLGFVQLDSVTTVERAHHMILFARRQSYRPPALAPLIEKHRGLWEHWTHDASVLPAAYFPHWKHRFAQNKERLKERWQKWQGDEYHAKIGSVLDQIARDGPLRAADLSGEEGRGQSGWWDWNPSKAALEYLWHTGELSITRREGFQKVYDLTERVVPLAHRQAAPDAEETTDWACRAALARLGFATSGELAAFWALIPPEAAKAWCQAAKARGEIIEIAVENQDGSRRRSFAAPDVLDEAARLSPAPARMRILSPFDPALRDRARAERLFGFSYRIEIFVPEAQRDYGYYVFPVLEGERLVGRIDAKAQRDSGTLAVTAFWPEKDLRWSPARSTKLEAATEKLARFAACTEVDWAKNWLRPPKA